MKIELYKIGVSQSVLYWSVEQEDHRTIKITWGTLDGVRQVKREDVSLNGSGRDYKAQVALRINIRIKRQKDRGYCDSIEEARASLGVNALKLPRPMLAQKLRNVRNVDYANSYYQYKYNGHRCLIANIDGEIIPYSRNGSRITTLDHIVKDVDIEPGHILDGEVYAHGQKLQTIASWAKRKQANTSKLQYVMYDVITDEPMNYNVRLSIVEEYARGNLIASPTWKCGTNGNNITAELTEALAQSYEGLMIRQGLREYEAGVRSTSLIKVKKLSDNEFLVVDVIPSKDGWGILVCRVPNSQRTFRVSAPGTMKNKEQILLNRVDYIGKYVNVQFFEWTKDLVPFHPVATDFVENIS